MSRQKDCKRCGNCKYFTRQETVIGRGKAQGNCMNPALVEYSLENIPWYPARHPMQKICERWERRVE